MKAVMRHECSSRRQHGYALLELAIAALLLLLGAVWAASRWQDDVRDAGAQATARYLLTMRGATHEMLVQHFDKLAGYPDPPEGYGASVALPAYLDQPLPLDLGVAELVSARGEGQPGYLPADFPLRPVYGGEARVRIWREGDCPGEHCRLEAVVHTTEPISADGAEHSPELIGQVIMASDGYGGHAPSNAPQRLRGAVFDVANPMGELAGVVGVTAALDTTLFHQFVRQGDTRPIWLRNRLHVAGTIASASGLALQTEVTPGDACLLDGLYASSVRQSLVMCLTGVWFELARYVVTGQRHDLQHGAVLPEPECPGGMQAFMRVGLQSLDVDVPGADIQIRGVLAGSISGSGTVDPTGSVEVSGSFDGSVTSSPDSRIRIVQRAGVAGGVLELSAAGAGARAYAVYGCQYV